MKKIYLDLGVVFTAFGVAMSMVRWFNDTQPTETNVTFVTFGLLLVGLSLFNKEDS